jgi:hypothetical protein
MPQRACAEIMIVAFRLRVIITCETQKRTTAARKTLSAPYRCTSLAPSITKPATIIE